MERSRESAAIWRALYKPNSTQLRSPNECPFTSLRCDFIRDISTTNVGGEYFKLGMPVFVFEMTFAWRRYLLASITESTVPVGARRLRSVRIINSDQRTFKNGKETLRDTRLTIDCCVPRRQHSENCGRQRTIAAVTI